MSGFVSKFLAQLKNPETRSYFMSTHFWGPFLNWSIPIATFLDSGKDPRIISGKMTLALSLYSAVFLRFALVVIPKNMLMFSMHVANIAAQGLQGSRFIKYHYMTPKPAQ